MYNKNMLILLEFFFNYLLKRNRQVSLILATLALNLNILKGDYTDYHDNIRML